MNKNKTFYTGQISEYAFIAYFFIHSFFPFSANTFKELCLLAVVGCWITKMISEKRFIFAKTSINIPIFSFILCLLLASFHSAHIKWNLESVLHDDIKYFLIFFGMVNTIQGKDQIKRIVKAMLITFGMVCTYGLYSGYTGHEERLMANFIHPNIIAQYISLILPITVCLYFYYENALNHFYMVLLIFVSSICLILTMGRTSWVAVFITIIFIGFAIQKKYVILILIGICVLPIFILPSKFITHAKTITQINKYFTSEEILGQRLLCWKASIAMIKDHPVFGLGPSSRIFREVYQQYANEIRVKEEQNLQKNGTVPEQFKETEIKIENQKKEIEKLPHPHNIILHIGTETGIVGLLVFLWLFISVFYAAVKLWRVLGAGYEKMLLIGIIASLISIFLNGLTDSFWRKPNILFLWYIIGILFVVIHSISNQNLIRSKQGNDTISLNFNEY